MFDADNKFGFVVPPVGLYFTVMGAGLYVESRGRVIAPVGAHHFMVEYQGGRLAIVATAKMAALSHRLNAHGRVAFFRTKAEADKFYDECFARDMAKYNRERAVAEAEAALARDKDLVFKD